MAKDDLIPIDGVVANVTGGGDYIVTLANGSTVSARISGKMRKFKIRILVGDKVTVSLSPYDLTHGLITHRQRVMMPAPQR